MEIDASVLEGTGLSRREIQEVLECRREEDRIRRLRACRSRLLSEIHTQQQTLDNVDYIIWSKTQEERQLNSAVLRRRSRANS